MQSLPSYETKKESKSYCKETPDSSGPILELLDKQEEEEIRASRSELGESDVRMHDGSQKEKEKRPGVESSLESESRMTSDRRN